MIFSCQTSVHLYGSVSEGTTVLPVTNFDQYVLPASIHCSFIPTTNAWSTNPEPLSKAHCVHFHNGPYSILLLLVKLESVIGCSISYLLLTVVMPMPLG